MQTDVFTRVVLVLILACLASLLVGQLGAMGGAPADDDRFERPRGRYAITMARQPGGLVVLRTDVHTGEVARTTLQPGTPWELLGVEASEEPASDAADAPAP